jgi:GLPGLI family protein
MITIIRVLIIALTLIVTSVSAQDFQGVATYKSQTKIDIKMDSTQVNSAMQEQMMEMLKKQMQKTYKLTFNKEASIYKEEESLAPPQPSGMQVMMVMTGGSDVMYKNTKENRFTNQNESFSKLFLIKDELVKHEWELGSETKSIGEYTCYKATKTRERPVMSMSFSSNDDEDAEEEEEKEPEMETIVITAWYTPQIPVSTGPGNYHGLPGLILQVNDGNTTLICSKIVLNPKDKVEIVEPKKGKELSQEAYDKIMEKKEKEMMERFRSNRRGRDDGETISISIGG